MLASVGVSTRGFIPRSHTLSLSNDLPRFQDQTSDRRERYKFIIRQPPIGEKDDYDSENFWISDGLPSSSRRRRKGDGRWEVAEWREK